METSIITFKNDENIVNYSVLDGICGAYKATIEEVEKAVDHLLKATEIIQNVGLAHSSYFLLNGVKNNLSYADSDKERALERMTEEIRQGVWESLYKKLPVNRFMTESVKKQVDALFKEASAGNFTQENIKKLIDTIYLNGKNIITEGMKEVFSTLTRYHSYKTNDKNCINKKVILDHCINFSFGRYDVSYYYRNTIDDIDRIMCYIDGTNFNDCKTVHAAIRETTKDINTCESSYFKIKCFKKGTLHLEFKDDRLRRELNILASNGGLPDRT